MNTQVTFRHLKSRPELHEAALESAQRFTKFYDGITNTNVEFIADNNNTVEFRVRINGNVLVVRESSDDFMKSLHTATDKMIRQLKKQKTKQSNKLIEI
ncbi:MAG: ribosome-associated translation inhibitor RaiA [Candidatus Kapabacteria bacterium]|nr:ribosome-associated translation inhibitor RaiA [Candidatus Kapabacteria bacterium]